MLFQVFCLGNIPEIFETALSCDPTFRSLSFALFVRGTPGTFRKRVKAKLFLKTENLRKNQEGSEKKLTL